MLLSLGQLKMVTRDQESERCFWNTLTLKAPAKRDWGCMEENLEGFKLTRRFTQRTSLLRESMMASFFYFWVGGGL